MTKVHPNATISPEFESPELGAGAGDGLPADATVLTVWRKSLLFNCSGFTVYDSKGNLVFRVDNYGSGSKAELVLMDAAGKPLLTVRRKVCLNVFAENWLIYNGEESSKPIFSLKKHVNLRQSKAIAHAAARCGAGGRYDIEGSYAKRSCEIYDELRRTVAEVRPKEAAGGVALGDDVFRLLVRPDADAALAMAVLIVVDQMYS